MMAQSQQRLQTPSSNQKLRNALLRLQFNDDVERRSLALRHAARDVMDAKDQVSDRRREAMSALRQSKLFKHGAEFSEHRSYYRAHGKLAVARATRKTLMAEKKLISRRIREAKLRLQAWYEAEETVKSQLTLAELNLVGTLTEMRTFGWMSMTTSAKRPAAISGPWPAAEDPWLSDVGESEESDEDMDCSVGSEDGGAEVVKPEGSGD